MLPNAFRPNSEAACSDVVEDVGGGLVDRRGARARRRIGRCAGWIAACENPGVRSSDIAFLLRALGGRLSVALIGRKADPPNPDGEECSRDRQDEEPTGLAGGVGGWGGLARFSIACLCRIPCHGPARMEARGPATRDT